MLTIFSISFSRKKLGKGRRQRRNSGISKEDLHQDCVSVRELQARQSVIEKLENSKRTLESQIGQLQAELDRMRLDRSELEKNIWPLQKKLSQEDQAYIATHHGSIPPTWILKQSLRQFKTLENMLDAREQSHQLKIAEERSHHDTEMNNLIDGYAADKKDLERNHKRELSRKQAEIERLENGLLTNVDRFQPLSDATLKTRFTTLKKAVTDLARCNIEAEAEAVGVAFNQTELVHDMKKRQWMYLLEGNFWRILADGLFLTPFSVFGSHGNAFVTIWHDLFQKRGLIFCIRLNMNRELMSGRT